nr:MAG TPA: outer membrane protein assembly factor [Caudoviricetes sp.]
MKTILKSTLAGAVALALSACGSMQAAPSKPADLYRHGMQRQFKQDTQYNLSGKATFALYETEQSRQMRHERIEDDVKWKAEWAQRDKKPLSAAEQNKIRQEFQEKQARRDKTTQTLFNALSVHYTGAMDLPRGKIELVPELHYETRNALGSLKVPMQLDIKAQTAYVDLGAFEPSLPLADSALSADKPIVRFRLPKQWQNKIPFADVWRALPKAYDESIKALGDDAFTALPLNDTARKIGARHRIALHSNSKQSVESTKVLFQSLQQQLREQGKPGNANISQADYDRFVASLEAISSAVQGETL